MSNKLNFPGNRNNNHNFDPLLKAKPQPLPVDINKLDSFHCPQCKCSAFKSVFQLMNVPALYSQTGRDEILKVDLLMCLSCAAVYHPTQLVKLSAKEREAIRVELEMRHLGQEEVS